jgi:hypothetical protein
MQPRIYTYKITFEEVPYWYWGVHKEKKFGEKYWGSPVTHRWVWDFYTPRIQILEFFPYTDEGWKEANLVEDRLIKPDLNDPLCLNEGCGARVSREAAVRGGKAASAKVHQEKDEAGKSVQVVRAAMHNVTNQTGFLNPEYRQSEKYIEDRRRNGHTSAAKIVEERLGILSPEWLNSEECLNQRKRNGKKAGEKTVEGKLGILSPGWLESERCKTQRIANGKKAGSLHVANGTGFLDPDYLQSEKKAESNKKAGLTTSSQRWQCTVTVKISNPGPLTRYQRARGIDPTNRVKLC